MLGLVMVPNTNTQVVFKKDITVYSFFVHFLLYTLLYAHPQLSIRWIYT